MVISPFRFLKKNYKIIRGTSIKLSKPSLAKRPEVLYTINMTLSPWIIGNSSSLEQIVTTVVNLFLFSL
jgi:hypothetical protein